MPLGWALVCLMAAGCALGELGGSDSWLLMVEAGRDVPGRRITPKSVFIAPAHPSRAENCLPGFRYDHRGRCVKVVRVDPSAQLQLFLKRLQGAPGFKPNLPPPKPPSAGPLHFSLPLGLNTAPTQPVVPTIQVPTTEYQLTPSTVAATTAQDIKEPSTLIPAPATTLIAPPTAPSITVSLQTPPLTSSTVKSDQKTKETLSTTTSASQEQVTTFEEATESSRLEDEATLPARLEGDAATPARLPIEGSGQGTAVIAEGSGEQTTPASVFEGSGQTPTEEVYGTASTLSVEGSGSGTTTISDDAPAPTALAEEERDTRSTTSSSEEDSSTETPDPTTIEAPSPTNCCDDRTPIPPTDTTASLLLALLKGMEVWKPADPPKIEEAEDVRNETAEQNTETTTVDPDEGKTDQLPIIEYIDLVLPSSEDVSSESNDTNNTVLIPLENIKWNFSDTKPYFKTQTDVENITESVPVGEETRLPLKVIIDGLKVDQSEVTERTESDFESVTERTLPVDSHENKVAADGWWVETMPIGSSWVRFPDHQMVHPPPSHRRGPLDQLPLPNRSNLAAVPLPASRFRFPEEAVDPEHRQTLFKFWSRIPMIRDEEPSRKEYQSDEDHWIAP